MSDCLLVAIWMMQKRRVAYLYPRRQGEERPESAFVGETVGNSQKLL